MGVSGDNGRMVRQLSPRLHVLQSGVVSCPVRLCGRAFSLVLGAYARGPRHLTVDPPRTYCRSDGRRLLSQRHFPPPASYRIPACVRVVSNDRNLRRPESFFPKPGLPPIYFRCYHPHLHHAQNYFWRLPAFWLLPQSCLGLVRPQLGFSPFFLGSWPG